MQLRSCGGQHECSSCQKLEREQYRTVTLEVTVLIKSTAVGKTTSGDKEEKNLPCDLLESGPCPGSRIQPYRGRLAQSALEQHSRNHGHTGCTPKVQTVLSCYCKYPPGRVQV